MIRDVEGRDLRMTSGGLSEPRVGEVTLRSSHDPAVEGLAIRSTGQTQGCMAADHGVDTTGLVRFEGVFLQVTRGVARCGVREP